MTPLNQTARTFLRSLENSKHVRDPFDYWLIEDVLPDVVCDGIAEAQLPMAVDAVHDGRRESNNAQRIYFTPDNQALHQPYREVTEAFRHPIVKEAIEQATGTNLREGRLRVEYCQDVDGFWLEPHVDISVKLFTMLVYLTDSPDLHDAGTDIYDASPEHKLVATAPYEWNAGLIFIPGKDTWHGFSKRPIRGVRKSIIINYVAPEWRAINELA